MGIREDIQTSMKEAFDTDLKDVVCSFEIIKKTIGEYSVNTGVNETTETEHESRGVFEAMPTKKVNGTSILFTDEQLIINANELDTNLEVDDKIILESGTVYNVVAPNPVMGGDSIPIIYEAQVRKNA